MGLEKNNRHSRRMIFCTCYKYGDEDLEVEIEAQGLQWKILRIGFNYNVSFGTGHVQVWLDQNELMYNTIATTIYNDHKFSRYILNELI